MQFLIADDHMAVRQAIVQLIRDEWPQADCDEVDDGVRLVEKALQGGWDLVVSDIAMPRMNGLEAMAAIRRTMPVLPVLIVSIHTDNRYAVYALRLGAMGYLAKSKIEQELVKAIRTILDGDRYMTDEMAGLLGV
jgi:two-component system, NarL family, invasion response regulator UvrY